MNTAFLRGYQCPPDVFAELCASLLQSGKSIRVFARGDSMLPNLRGGDTLFCSPLDGRPVRVGDIVLYLTPNRQTLFHRVIRAREQDGERFFQVQGDNSLNPEGWKSTAEILGRVARVIRSNGMEQGMDTLVMRLFNRWAAFRSRRKLNRFQRLRALEQGFFSLFGG